MIEKQESCFIWKRTRIRKNQINLLFGDVIEKHQKIERFMKQDKTRAAIIPVENLNLYDVALFQHFRNPDEFQEYNLSDVMVEFHVDNEKGTVTTLKLFRWNGQYVMEKRIYYIENYGKTWRAWSALPERRRAANWT